MLVPQDSLDQVVNLEVQVRWEQSVHLDLMGIKVRQGRMELLDLLDREDSLEPLANRDKLDHPVLLANQVLKVQEVISVLLDRWDPLVLKDPQVLEEILEHPDLRAIKEVKEQPDRLETPVQLEILALLVQLDRLALKVLQV
jgi:hypothetical protein